jgi:hypothetical protein
MSDTHKSTSETPGERIIGFIKKKYHSMQHSTDAYLNRRPHRSFRLTRRRDYRRSLQLPGYWAFTQYVRKTIWQHKKTYLIMAALYAVLTALLVGTASQDTYTILTDTLRDTGGDVFAGDIGALGQAGLLFLTTVSGGLRTDLTEVQSVYAALISLLVWLTTVWLLRNQLAGYTVKVRDGLYNASAPILSTAIIAVVLIIQLLPLSLALIGYSAASSTGLLNSGVEAMLFWIAASLLSVLSLYWMTSTLLAMVVVTLPGMYPFVALRRAGDIVIGRRLRLLLRFVWMIAGILLTWIVVMVPIILLDTWIKGMWTSLEWIPVIPTTLLLLSSLTIVWSASYVYLLYRKVVADDTDPA